MVVMSQVENVAWAEGAQKDQSMRVRRLSVSSSMQEGSFVLASSGGRGRRYIYQARRLGCTIKRSPLRSRKLGEDGGSRGCRKVRVLPVTLAMVGRPNVQYCGDTGLRESVLPRMHRREAQKVV